MSSLEGKRLTRIDVKYYKLGDIPASYFNKHVFSRTYIPYKPTIITNTHNILMDLFGGDIELDSEEIRLRYEMASYNFRRFLQLTGM